jgi:hypothetical protein
MVILSVASLAKPWFMWYQPMRIPQARQRIAAAHHTNEKRQTGK